MPNFQSQIPTYNFNSESHDNYDFSQLTRSFQGYVNQIIEKDKENKSVLEETQQSIDLAPPGNGTEGDIAVFKDWSKEVGQKIHALTDAGNGLTGYAGLTKQIEKLHHDVLTDSRLQALRQSYVHKQQLQQTLFGKETTEVMNADGTRSQQQKDAFPGWSTQYKEQEYARVMKHSGVKQDPDTKKYVFQGANFDLPQYIDKETYFREKFKNEIQEYEQKTGAYWTMPDKGLGYEWETGIKGKNWQGLNDAITLAMQTDPKYNAFINKKVELEHYNSTTDSYDFSLAKQKQQAIEDNVVNNNLKYGTKAENIPQYLTTLKASKFQADEDGHIISDEKGNILIKNYKGKPISTYNYFKKVNGFNDNDTPEEIKDKITKHENEILTNAFDDHIKRYRITNNIPLDGSGDEQKEKEMDYFLGKNIAVDSQRQNDTNIITTMNKLLYGKDSDYTKKLLEVDFEKRKKEREEEKKKNNDYRTLIENGSWIQTEDAKNYTKTDETLESNISTNKLRLANLLKTTYGNKYDGKTSPYDFLAKDLADHKDDGTAILDQNKDIYDSYTSGRELDQQHEINNSKIEDIRKTARNLDPKSFTDYTLKLTSELSKPDYINYRKQEQEETYKAQQNIGVPYGTNIVIKSDADFSTEYNNNIKRLADLLSKNGISKIQSHGEMIFNKMSKEDQETVDDMILPIIEGKAAGVIHGKDLNDVTTESSDWKGKLAGLYKNDNTFNTKALTSRVIIDDEPGIRVATTLPTGETYNIDATAVDPMHILLNTIIKSLNKDIINNGEKMSGDEYTDKYNIMWSMIGKSMNGKRIIPDNTQEDKVLKVDAPLYTLKTPVNNLERDKYIDYITENGVPIRFKKVNGLGDNGGAIELQSQDDKTGKWTNIYGANSKKNFRNFSSCIPSLSRYVAQQKGNGQGGLFMTQVNSLNAE